MALSQDTSEVADVTGNRMKSVLHKQHRSRVLPRTVVTIFRPSLSEDANLLFLALVAGQLSRGDPDHMADTTAKTQYASIKSIMAGGVWRSRRVIAAVAITAGVAFGAFGASVPQADASIGWCRGCTGLSGAAEPSVVGKNVVYTVRHNVYASVN